MCSCVCACVCEWVGGWVCEYLWLCVCVCVCVCVCDLFLSLSNARGLHVPDRVTVFQFTFASQRLSVYMSLYHFPYIIPCLSVPIPQYLPSCLFMFRVPDTLPVHAYCIFQFSCVLHTQRRSRIMQMWKVCMYQN